MPSRLNAGGTASNAGYRGDIDGLRAVSIIAVVLFHAGIDRVAGGYVGVDVFFVISGFLITGLLVREVDRSGRVSMREFYARRIRRLLPLSFVTIMATLVAGLWLLPPVARGGLVADARAASLYVANWRYAGQATAYSDTEVTDSLLVHYWSLAIEEQFYILWPVLIVTGLAISRLVRRPARPILGALLGTLGIVSFALSVTITNREGIGAYYLTHTRLWEMAFGAGLALTVHRIPRQSTTALDLVGGAGLAAIAIGVFTFDHTTPFPGSAALLPVAGCAAVLISGSQEPGLVARSLAAAPLRLIGRLSYAWYLLHWPSIGIGLLLRDRYSWGLSVGATTALAVTASFGLAWIAHHTIENPVRVAPVLRTQHRPNFVMGAALTTIPLLFGGVLLAKVDRGDSPVVVEGEDGPIQLAQTPAQAIDDDVRANPACHLGIAETNVADDCVFGDPEGERTVVLLGDSHARQWLDALDELGRQEGWKVYAWTKSACSIVDAEVYLPVQERRYDECRRWREAVTARTAEIEKVDVILLARASSYVDLVMDGESIVAADDVGPYWSDAFARTAASFLPLTDELVLVADTPWPGFSPPECLSNAPATLAECSFALTPALRDRPLLDAEQGIAEENGIRIIDPVPLPCPDDPCSVVTPDGIITYRDSHHLTRTFTLTLLDDLRTWVTG